MRTVVPLLERVVLPALAARRSNNLALVLFSGFGSLD